MERRSALQLIAGGVIGSQLEAAQRRLVTVVAAPADYKLQFFTLEQNKTIDALADMIIPADVRSAGAHEAKVSLFIDLIVANGTDEVKNEWLAGIRSVEREAAMRYHAAFANCTAQQREELLAAMAAHETDPSTDLERFFVRLKTATIDGYYTSAIGIHQELRYKGNTVLAEFPGCTHPDHEL
jgi:gluconate 2-dehydrogenase gamma chain